MTLQRKTPLRARRADGATRWTHGKLVRLVGRWLRTTRGLFVLEEIASEAEQPDCIAWDGRGRSTVVEVKASRADYLADRSKHFRREPTLGMGRERFFAAPVGLLVGDELPDGWGLVEVSERGCRVTKSGTPFGAMNHRGEAALLVSALRRVTEGWGRGVFGEAAPADVMAEGDPHPKVARIMRKQKDEIERLELALEGARRERDETLETLTRRVRELEAMVACQVCSGPVEAARRCYAIPTCYRCLPPPEPLPVREVITP